MQAWRVHEGERATKALLGPKALHMGTILTPRQEVLVKNQRRKHGGEVGHVFWLIWKEKSDLNPWPKMRDV